MARAERSPRYVGRRYLDEDGSGGRLTILFKIPEDGEDDALYVVGALQEPAQCVEGAVVVFPKWEITEWDGSDLAKAKAARAPQVVAAAPPQAGVM